MIKEFEGYTSPSRGLIMSGGQATWDGQIIVSEISRAEASALLPDYLKLAEPKDRSTNHYLVILIGRHHDLKMILFGIQFGLWRWICESYSEMIVLLPFVVKTGSDCWYNYIVGMVLDNWLAIDVGNRYFGYRKQFGLFSLDPSAARIDYADAPIFHACVSRGGQDNLWNRIDSMFAAPILSDGLGRPVITHWAFDAQRASMAPVRVDYKFHEFCNMNGLASGDGVAIKGLRWRLNTKLRNF